MLQVRSFTYYNYFLYLSKTMANKRSPAIPMTQELKLELERLSRQRSLSAGLLSRVQIVLHGAAGKSDYWISREMGISEGKVKRWRKS